MPHPQAPVSVVIPTRNRPASVVAAVGSALAQATPPWEVIVVVDGEDAATSAALSAITDPRLRVIRLGTSVGGAEARNIGVRAATGDWIGLLDDDDLWLPGKLSAQLAFAATLPPATSAVLSCPVLARSPEWEEVWPREPYRPGQPMAEYLFCRKGWSYGAALLQTSTLLASRALLLRRPFTAGLKKHQDWDWLLRVSSEPGVEVHPVGTEPLVIFHVEGERASVGRVRDWRFSLTWACSHGSAFSPRAFRAFVTTECAAQAESAGWRDRALLLRALLGKGLPSPAELAQFLVFLLVPQPARRKIRNLARRLRTRLQKQPAGEAPASVEIA